MRVVHETEGSRRVLATDVRVADSLLAKAKGLMGRRSVPEEFALVFEFESGPLERLAARLPGPLGDRAGHRSIHMLFVRTPIDVVWVEDGEVVEVRTLDPWRGTGAARADTVIEMAAGAADGVDPGDRVSVTDDGEGEVDHEHGDGDGSEHGDGDDTTGTPNA